MRVGRVFGRAVLALVDALAAGLLGGLLAFLVLPVVFVSTRTQLVLLVTGAITGVLFAISLALVGLGKRPFPATRLVKGALSRLLWWF